MRIRTMLGWAISLTEMASAAIILTDCPVRADDGTATAGEISVEGVAASPARAGETTRLTFTIRNDGAERVLVTGAGIDTGEASRIIGFLGSSHAAPIGSLPVEPEEELRLGGRTAWIELGPLKSDLPLGSRLAARLLLGRGSVPLDVHVTAAPAGPGTGSASRVASPFPRGHAPC